MKKSVIPVSISVSFQMNFSPTPLSIIDFKMMMNHLAGMMLLMVRSGNGMLEIGKMNPDKMITGSIKPMSEMSMAVCCELETVEIKIPSDNAHTINKILSKASRKMLPLIGIPKTK